MSAAEGNRESCACSWCQAACTHKPGWFLPGEAELAAALLNMSLPDFFARYLAVDWWDTDEAPVFVLSPAVREATPGTEFPGDPRGTCVFFETGNCRIHEAKPHECRQAWHGDGPGEGYSHEATAMAWKGHQAQPAELLGRPPQPSHDGWLAALLGLAGLADPES